MTWKKKYDCDLVLSNDGDSDRFAVADDGVSGLE